MELSQFKKSVQEIAKTVGAIVEEKLGERSKVGRASAASPATVERRW